MRRAATALLACASLAAVAASTAAQDGEPVYGARAVAEARPASTHPEDPTAAGTVAEVRERNAPGESVQDLLADVPGARVVATGAAGSFAGVALRGAELAHTTVLLGDLPLSGPDTGTLDLGLVPLAVLDRIEVYRGGAPARFGDGAIGGVVRLVPRAEPETAAGVELATGSFDAYRLDGWASAVAPGFDSFGAVGVRSSAGDFPYLDDGGTRFVPADDVERRRANADLVQGHGLARVAAELGEGRVEAVVLGVTRDQGEPGPASAPALQARRFRTVASANVGYSLSGGDALPFRLALGVGGAIDANRLTDEYAELGLLPKVTDDRTTGAYGRALVALDPLDWLEVTLLGAFRYDHYRPRDALSSPADLPSERFTPAATLETRAHGRLGPVRVELRPSVRVAYTGASIHGTLPGAEQLHRTEHVLPTLRVGALVAPLAWLSIVGSFSTGRRAPSMLELFGDRGVLLPSPDLRPESSVGFDAGVVARGREGLVRGELEARYFQLEVSDLIRYRRTAQEAAVAENVASGATRGVEAGVRGAIGAHVALASAVTFMDARADTGRRLPFRPGVVLSARPELSTGPLGRGAVSLSTWVEVEHVGANYVDPANLVELPARTWVAAGVGALVVGRVRFDLAVRDLADARGQDLLGYPLPGRRFDATLGGRFD